MYNKDFIPTKETDFQKWEKLLIVKLAAGAVKWSYPADRWQALTDAQALFEAKYALAEDRETRTPVVVTAKNEAKEAFVGEIRTFLAAYITNNPDVTDPDRVGMGLPVHSKTHTHHPITQLRPNIVATGGGAREVILEFQQPGGSRTKPEYVTGIAFTHVISDTPIEDALALEATVTTTKYFTRTLERVYYTAAQSGKFLCGYACYTNATAERGQFGDVICIRIP
jgi:hypothetical protein